MQSAEFGAVAGQSPLVKRRALHENVDRYGRPTKDETGLMKACLAGNEAEVRCLLSMGADVHRVDGIGMSALYYAIRPAPAGGRKSLGCMRMLLEARASVAGATTHNRGGWGALHLACRRLENRKGKEETGGGAGVESGTFRNTPDIQRPWM